MNGSVSFSPVKGKSGDQPESIRKSNRQLVLDLVRSKGSVTASDLMGATGLSRTTVLKAFDFLQSRGVVEPAGKGKTTLEGGKPPALYRYNVRFGYVISVHILGERINMAVTDAAAGLGRFVQEPIPVNTRIETILDLLASFIESVPLYPEFCDKPCLGIVIASSGVIDLERGMILSAAHFPSWGLNTPLRRLLSERISIDCPIFIDNYNRFETYAEYTRGAARGLSIVVDIVVSWDGLGAGIMSEGKLLYGPKSLAGEIGHMCINPQDDEGCHCGSRGCFERQVSVQRLLARANAEDPDRRRWDLHSLLEAYRQGDAFAEEAMDEVARWMAIGISNVNLVINPDVFILSGLYQRAGDKFLRRIAQYADTVSMGRMPKELELKLSSFGDEAAIVGGALFAIDTYFQKGFAF